MAEVDAMRTTIDSLRTRLAGLEAMLGTVLGTPQAMSAQTGLVTPPETAYGAPHAVPAFPAQESSLPYRNDTGLASSHAYPSYRPGPSPMPTAITSPSAESSSGLLPQRFAVATAHHASSGRSDSYDASPPPFSSHYPLPQLLSNSSTAAEPQEVVFPDSGRKSPSLNHGFDTPESDPSCRLSHLRPELRKEEVAASLSLEWMALGRTAGSTLSEQSSQAGTTSVGATAGDLSSSIFSSAMEAGFAHPLDRFPTSASLAEVLPADDELEQIVRHALEWTNWLHAAVHDPTFRAEVREFLEAPREGRLERVNHAWLALLFTQLCCGVKHMPEEHLELLGSSGLSQYEADMRAKQYLEAALACLYQSHFLVTRDLHAVQAIVILVVGCQDGTPSNLFPTLLSLGVALAQDLGLHRLPSDQAFSASIAPLPLAARARSLVEFETKKRVFWSLACQDWFNIVFRRTTAIQPTQVTTPLPSNAHDEDLMSGIVINRPPHEYTVAGKMLVWIQVARLVQRVFQYIDENPNPSYAVVLDLDEQLKRLLANAPAWLVSDAVHDPNLPPNAAWMRTTFIISSAHKTLTLHRNFFRRFEPSRRRTLEASRAILREAAKVGDTRMWTIPYHISAAASVVCLDLFQRISPPAVLVTEREEVVGALGALRRMSSFSAIAQRGEALLSSLLLEESRLPPIVVPTLQSDQDEEQPVKKQRTSPASESTGTTGTSAAQASSSSAPSVSSASLAHLLATPPEFTLPLPGDTAAAAPSAVPHPPLSLPPAQDFFESDILGLLDDLPPSFTSAFLETGFDPLDGGWEV